MSDNVHFKCFPTNISHLVTNCLENINESIFQEYACVSVNVHEYVDRHVEVYVCVCVSIKHLIRRLLHENCHHWVNTLFSSLI